MVASLYLMPKVTGNQCKQLRRVRTGLEWSEYLMCFGLDEPQPPFTRYNRLSNRLYNQFDNRLYRVNKHPTGCQTGCQTGLTTGLTTVLNEQLFVQPVVNLGCTTGLTTGLTTGCIVYTNIYRVVKPVWQQVVSCTRGFTDVRPRIIRYTSGNWAMRPPSVSLLFNAKNKRKESNSVKNCSSIRWGK